MSLNNSTPNYMLRPYLRAIQIQLSTKIENCLVDIWNSQTTNTADAVIGPSVFIDFGLIKWSSLSTDVKQGFATIQVHCVCADYTGALDDAANLLTRFSFASSVLAALENFVAKDEAGLILFKGLELSSSQMSTNADALKDDVISFNTILYYYDVWREKNWQEIILQDVETTYDPNAGAEQEVVSILT